MRTSEKSSTIAAALYAVHRDLQNPRKDSRADVRSKGGASFSYEYLSLPALIDHAKKALKEAQVAVIQDVVGEPGWVGVTTRFQHLTGEWLEVGPVTMVTMGDPQQLGSIITYLRRYALAAALNLAADEDDDASSAKVEPQVTKRTSVGMAAAEDGGSVPYGEGGTEPSQRSEGAGLPGPAAGTAAPSGPSSPSDAQRYMDEFHPSKPHKMAQSETVPTLRYCKGYGNVRCAYTTELKTVTA